MIIVTVQLAVERSYRFLKDKRAIHILARVSLVSRVSFIHRGYHIQYSLVVLAIVSNLSF